MRVALLLGLLMACRGVMAEPPVFRFASAEWPPYVSASLPEQGAGVAAVRQAYRAVGVDIQVDFLPWGRALHVAENDAAYVGYFPEYFLPGLAAKFDYSPVIARGPLGLVERVDHPVRWAREDDLAQFRLGVVQGYSNTPALDALITRGALMVEAVVTDRQNVLKVAAGHLDAAVIDAHVLAYLLAHDPELKPLAPRLRLNARLLAQKELFVCFKRNAQGRQARQLLEQGMKVVDVPGAIGRALQQP